MNVDEAREIFEREVLATKPDCDILEGKTREYPSCFVFFYQSKKFIETGNFADLLVGQGPVLISREGGKVFETGSAFSLSHYVDTFEACGDPFGKPTEKVKIVGWHPGANKVRATQLVKEKSGMGLQQSKAVIDKALEGGEPVFKAVTVEDAGQAVVELNKNGFNTVQLWSNQG